MTTHASPTPPAARDIWFISPGRYAQLDLAAITDTGFKGRVKEYTLSDVGRYLLNPHPVEIEKRLVGCEIHTPASPVGSFKAFLRRLRPHKRSGAEAAPNHTIETIVSPSRLKVPPLTDTRLEAHFKKICDALRPYDPVYRRLNGVDSRRVVDIVGICEDVGGNQSMLSLQGNPDEKLDYVRRNITKHVSVIIEKAYLSEGLFELRGFDFKNYDGSRRHRLIAFKSDDTLRVCVLDAKNDIDFEVADTQLLPTMQLIEQSVGSNPKLMRAFEQCLRGRSQAQKLMINRQIEIDYSQGRLPQVYREVFKAFNWGTDEKKKVVAHLNRSQLSVSLNTSPQTGTGAERLITNISVMHDITALEPIRKNLPQLYTEISKRTAASEMGRYYLLDAIRGYRHG